MSNAEQELLELRKQIDATDNEIIQLLTGRVEIVKKVGRLKHKSRVGKGSFIRSGREAAMLRDLTKKNTGMPPRAIATIWRMIISSSLSIEQEMKILAYCDNADNSCFWLAREYFGTFIDMEPVSDAEKIIAQVTEKAGAVGVLPLHDSTENPWWVRPDKEKNSLYVFARIPFIEDKDPMIKPALAIANVMPEATEKDTTLFAVTTNKGKNNIEEIFRHSGLAANIISTGGESHFLVETEGFMASGGEEVNKLEAAFAAGGDRLRLMGAYAVPVVV